MDTIKKDHIAILSLFVQLAKLSRLSNELIAQLIKRLLVNYRLSRFTLMYMQTTLLFIIYSSKQSSTVESRERRLN